MKARGERQRQAFTLIEVMVSLGVMTVGAMAIVALQQHTIRSNSHARQVTTAMQIAQRWVERLKQDAHTWNAPGTLAQTAYLQQIVANPNVFQTINVAFNPPGNPVSNAFDYQGNDIANNSVNPPIFYCASFRPAWVFNGRAMRVDVRVWWAREGFEPTAGTLAACADDNTALNPTGAQFNNQHVVYLPSVIRMVPLFR
jgi:prepilin-type N-terminal cleavage/methylation domain-containing protein